MKYRVEVVRKLSWRFAVEADSEERARAIAENMALKESDTDDWIFTTQRWSALEVGDDNGRKIESDRGRNRITAL